MNSILRIDGTLIAEGESTVRELAEANKANLYKANLYKASLDGASLYGTSLNGASLNGASLDRASLDGASLDRANLNGASLVGANLYGANLNGASLNGANLVGTCLDHSAVPNGFVDGFETDGEFVIGYRTRKAGHVDQYRDGRFYSADFFSVAETECHPGLYLWPSLQMAKDFSGAVEFIRVRTRPSEVHKAGKKWRCRWFEVLGKAE